MTPGDIHNTEGLMITLKDFIVLRIAGSFSGDQKVVLFWHARKRFQPGELRRCHCRFGSVRVGQSGLVFIEVRWYRYKRSTKDVMSDGTFCFCAIWIDGMQRVH